MDSALRVLLVEDSSNDAELIVLHLRRGGFEPVWERIETEEEMNSALGRQSWDAILSDHSMPCFSAPAALALLKERDLDVPFLIVSGAIGEDAAVAAMKAGAHDYIAKDHLGRLVPALKRELREVRVRLEKRQAQDALRESEERYRTLVELSPDAVCVCQSGAIVFLNHAAANLLGAESATAVLGRPFSDFVPPDILDHGRQDITERAGTASPLMEDRLVRLDALEVDVEFAVSKVSWGGLPAIQLVFRDISERKKIAEERERYVREIERAQRQIEEQADMLARLSEDLALSHHEAMHGSKAKRRVVAGTSLEIRERLDEILGMTCFLFETELTSQRQRDVAKAVRGNGEGALHAINEILNYLAMESGELNLEMADFDLGSVLDTAAALPVMQAAERNLTLIPQIAENVPNQLWGDAPRLSQILEDLSSIAVRYCRCGEVVLRVSLAAEYDDAVDLRVGIGGSEVPQETWQNIFQPFAPADSTDIPVPARDALAMEISRRLVEQMGGTIEVEKQFSSGSMVWLTLPLGKVVDSSTVPEPLIAQLT